MGPDYPEPYLGSPCYEPTLGYSCRGHNQDLSLGHLQELRQEKWRRGFHFPLPVRTATATTKSVRAVAPSQQDRRFGTQASQDPK